MYNFFMEKREIIRVVYLYIATLIGLVLVVIGSVRLIDLGLKVFVFKNADRPVVYPAYPARMVPDGKDVATTTPEEEEKYKQEQLTFEKENLARDRQRTATQSISMIFVGIPLFFYHWKTAQRDRKEKQK